MNKIKIVNDNLEKVSVDDSIQIEYYQKEGLFAINEIKINIIKDTTFDILLNLKIDSRLNFTINIKDNINVNLNILTKGSTGKVQYKYNLDSNSCCNVFKFQDVDSIKEMIIVNLNGIKSNFDYNFMIITYFIMK